MCSLYSSVCSAYVVIGFIALSGNIADPLLEDLIIEVSHRNRGFGMQNCMVRYDKRSIVHSHTFIHSLSPFTVICSLFV